MVPVVMSASAQSRFETESRRARLASGRDDLTITAMTYLRASEITVITKAQLLHALETAPGVLEETND